MAQRGLATLDFLSLTRCGIGNLGVLAVAAASTAGALANLRCLFLKGNMITDKGGIDIAETLEYMPELQQLGIGTNCLCDVAATAIAGAAGICPDISPNSPT